jgi:hypothetical protein
MNYVTNLMSPHNTEGPHSWDNDNYCQRWQIYLCIEQLRRGVGFGGRGILEYFCGSAFIVSYFRMLGVQALLLDPILRF